MQGQVTSLTTIMRIVYCCAFKYQPPLPHSLSKTIAHWSQLYASRSYSYFVLKLLPRTRTSVINNYLSPLLSPLPLTSTTLTIMVIEFLKKTYEFSNEIHVETWESTHVQKQ